MNVLDNEDVESDNVNAWWRRKDLPAIYDSKKYWEHPYLGLVDVEEDTVDEQALLNKKDVNHNPNYLDQTLNQEFLDDQLDLDFAPPMDADFGGPDFWEELNNIPPPPIGIPGGLPPPPPGFGGSLPPPPPGFGGIPAPPPP